MNYDPPEEVKKQHYVQQVCLYLGDSSEAVQKVAEGTWNELSRNPRWGAVVVMKMIAGPKELDKVRAFAASMGFDPSHYHI